MAAIKKQLLFLKKFNNNSTIEIWKGKMNNHPTKKRRKETNGNMNVIRSSKRRSTANSNDGEYCELPFTLSSILIDEFDCITPSVQVFNDLFEELKRQLFSSSLQIDLDELIVPISSTSSLGNDLKGANYVLNYAGRAFYTLSQRGDWDKCLQQPTGDPAAHMAQSGGEATSSGIRCFNCDDNHHIKHCPLPRDHAKITKARNERGGGDQPSKF